MAAIDDPASEITRDERLTLLDVVAAVQDAAESDAEVAAALRHMVELGRVRFDGVSTDPLPWVAWQNDAQAARNPTGDRREARGERTSWQSYESV